jgi:hypothetical protein
MDPADRHRHADVHAGDVLAGFTLGFEFAVIRVALRRAPAAGHVAS